MPSFTAEQIERYKRHLLLDEVGAEGQRRLLESRVLIIGAGGLGSPAALYLAAAGVGTLGLVDFDRVDASNLQRQILYATADVGRPKVEVAAERLRALNPDVRVVAHPERLEAANARERIAAYDVVLDGTDTFPSRYLTSDVCVWERRPLVYGSIMRFEGQVSVFDATRGPCYRCLFPEPPPPELAPNCAAAGVLGVLPGVIGMLQATEVLKLLLGRGEPLIGRLVAYDALALEFRSFKLSRDPDCAVCGPAPRITEPIDYEAFCASAAGAHEGPRVAEITPHELALRLAKPDAPLLIDVRESWEHDTARIPGAQWMPAGMLESRLAELEPWRSRPVVIHCHHGGRSRKACELLLSRGFERVENLAGGIDAWSTQVDPSVPRY
jgi:adenylyltransferase/sulfurtransferase